VRAARLAVAVSIAGIAGCGSGTERQGSRLITVPNVADLSQAAAYCSLEAAGLRWRTGGELAVHSRVIRRRTADPRGGGLPTSGLVPHPCEPGGYLSQAEVHVLEQSPTPGTRVPPGTIVQLEDGCTLLRSLGTACL
jgi:hypothetical protein